MDLGEFKSKTLVSWYHEARTFQEERHGEHYTAMHNAVNTYLQEGDIYKELGVMQGVSVAAAMVKNPKRVEMVDINFDRFDIYQRIFYDYAMQWDIEIKKYHMSSHSLNSISDVDMLLIDSVHQPQWLSQELNLHAPKTRKHIIMHDTISCNLNPTIEKYVEEHPEWKIVTKNTDNVGYTHISKINLL